MRAILVGLQNRSYPIIIKRGVLSELGALMADLGCKGKAAVITNPRVGGIYGRQVLENLSAAGFKTTLITIPDGEEYKNLKELSVVYDSLIENKMERSSPIIALGGGVIGDISGFAAATYLRGVPYVQVPTTLLAQVDSSVGGKTAVNHPRGKNLIGAFYQPKAVFIDPQVLSTLDDREIRSGLAEVVKYGVIRDASFFSLLESGPESLLKLGDEMTAAIERACEIKAEVVGADETEQGLRSILNFGHTFGHAIEALTGYGTFKHGEAVSIGMVMAAGLSARLGFCKPEVETMIKSILGKLGLPVDPPSLNPDEFIESMMLDKKVIGDSLRFVLVESIGKVFLKEVKNADIKAFLCGLT